MPRAMRVDRLLGEHGIGQDSAAGRQEFERQMERRRLEAIDEEALKPLRRGWYLGREQAITARLRSETTLPIQWIAARGQIGTAKGAKSVLPHLAQNQDQRKTARTMRPARIPICGLGKGAVGVVVVPAHHGAAAMGERAVGDGRRIPSDAGHWPAEAERAAGIGAAEKATGAGL